MTRFFRTIINASGMTTMVVLYMTFLTGFRGDRETYLPRDLSSSIPESYEGRAEHVTCTTLADERGPTTATRPAVQPVPQHAKKRAFVYAKPTLVSVFRALMSRQYAIFKHTDHRRNAFPQRYFHRAHIIWSLSPQHFSLDSPRMQRWQRFNQLPNFHAWEFKDSFATGMRIYARDVLKKADVEFMPTTYVLHETNDARDLAKQFWQHTNNPATAHPWVLKVGNLNQGKGVQMIGPHTRELKRIEHALQTHLAPPPNTTTTSDKMPPLSSTSALPKIVQKGNGQQRQFEEKGTALSYLKDEDLTDPTSKCLMQHYICRELTYERRKFDIRAYWLVASAEPLIVLFHHGIMRVGNNIYNETDFSKPKSHLTTHTYREQEIKVSWQGLAELVRQHYEENKLELSCYLPQHVQDPFLHVENQMKSALTHMIHAFRETSFNMNGLSKIVDNGFANYGVDFVIDEDLDVWLIEAQVGAALKDGYGSVTHDLNTEMIPSIIDMVEEVQEKQSRGQKVMPLVSKGEWQLLYDSENDYSFHYDFPRRQDKPGCSLA